MFVTGHDSRMGGATCACSGTATECASAELVVRYCWVTKMEAYRVRTLNSCPVLKVGSAGCWNWFHRLDFATSAQVAHSAGNDRKKGRWSSSWRTPFLSLGQKEHDIPLCLVYCCSPPSGRPTTQRTARSPSEGTRRHTSLNPRHKFQRLERHQHLR